MNKKRMLGLGFIGLGLTIIDSNLVITGAAIGTENANYISFVGLIIFVLGGMLVVMNGLEGKVKSQMKDLRNNHQTIKSYRRQIEKVLDRKVSYNQAKSYFNDLAVRESILAGIPPIDAINLKELWDHNVQSGNWVEIARENPRYATGNQYRERQSTSLVRYWGSSNLLNEDGSMISKNKADKLFKRKGVAVGKTHEIIVPSKTKYGGRYKRVKGELKKEKLWGPMASPSEDYPPGESNPGSRVLHRHWEIKRGYKHL